MTTSYESKLDIIGRAIGWVDYPNDSIEQGNVWHLDSSRAPFGPIMNKQDWVPHKDIKHAMALLKAVRVKFNIHISLSLAESTTVFVDRIATNTRSFDDRDIAEAIVKAVTKFIEKSLHNYILPNSLITYDGQPPAL